MIVFLIMFMDDTNIIELFQSELFVRMLDERI